MHEIGTDAAHARPCPHVRAAAVLCGVVAFPVLGIVTWTVWSAWDDGSLGKQRWVPAAVAIALFLGVGAALYFGLRARHGGGDVLFDRRVGAARGVWWDGGIWRRDVNVRLTDIASLQLCSRRIVLDELGRVDGPSNYDVYELNVVLASPPGRRLGLGSHGDGAAVAADAAKLAAFLGCGVLNDAELSGRFRRAEDASRVELGNIRKSSK